ncbi:MAG: septum formation initiator family protein [Marinoscillum sp.]
MKQFFQKVPPIFKNFYFLSSLFFLIWMLFFDSNDIITQMKLSSKQEELESAKEFYESKIIEVKNDREALLNNQELLEKLAREKYLMKKETEDIYIIVEE